MRRSIPHSTFAGQIRDSFYQVTPRLRQPQGGHEAKTASPVRNLPYQELPWASRWYASDSVGPRRYASLGS